MRLTISYRCGWFDGVPFSQRFARTLPPARANTRRALCIQCLRFAHACFAPRLPLPRATRRDPFPGRFGTFLLARRADGVFGISTLPAYLPGSSTGLLPPGNISSPTHYPFTTLSCGRGDYTHIRAHQPFSVSCTRQRLPRRGRDSGVACVYLQRLKQLPVSLWPFLDM